MFHDFQSYQDNVFSLWEPEEGTPPLHEGKQYGSEAVVLIGD